MKEKQENVVRIGSKSDPPRRCAGTAGESALQNFINTAVILKANRMGIGIAIGKQKAPGQGS